MAEFVAVPVEPNEQQNAAGDQGRPVVLFETAESDLVALHGGAPDVKEMAASAAGRLEAIADAAEQVYRSVKDRLGPDKVEMEISVGLSGEVGWFVAKSTATGGLKLILTWDLEEGSTSPHESESGSAGT
jgi:hypothetical protein